MDSDDEIGIDSGNVSSDEDYDFMQVDEIQRSSGTAQEPVEYPFEVLTTEEIVQHMLDCIADVNNVVEVTSKTLNFAKSQAQSLHRHLFGSLLDWDARWWKKSLPFVVVTSITFACISILKDIEVTSPESSCVITNKIVKGNGMKICFRVSVTIFKHFIWKKEKKISTKNFSSSMGFVCDFLSARMIDQKRVELSVILVRSD